MKKPPTEESVLRSINLLVKRNKDANAKCEATMREASQISQTTEVETRKKYNLLMDSVSKMSLSIQRRECKLKKLKAKLAELQTMRIV